MTVFQSRRATSRPVARAAGAFVLAVGLTGGASAADEIAQLFVRAVALAALVYALVVLPPPSLAGRRFPILLVALAAGLVLLQLVPLPPGLWHALPGRALFADAAQPVVADGWRPLHLSPDRGYNALFSLLVPAAALVFAAHLSREERARLMLPVALLVVLSAVVGLLQLPLPDLSLFADHSDGAPVGLFANRNHQALFLACGIPLCAALGLRREASRLSARARAALTAGVLALILILILASGSRAGLGAAALASALTVIAFRREIVGGWRKLGRRSRRRIAVAGAATTAALVAGVIAMGRAVSLDRLGSVDIAGDLRARTLPAVFEMLGSYFPAGAGFGAFDPAFRRFETVDLLSTIVFNQAHDDYMQVAIEGGLPGVLLLAAGLIWFAARAVARVRAPEDTLGDAAARVAVVVIMLVAAASVVDYPARTPIFMMLLALAAGWLMPRGRAVGTRD